MLFISWSGVCPVSLSHKLQKWCCTIVVIPSSMISKNSLRSLPIVVRVTVSKGVPLWKFIICFSLVRSKWIKFLLYLTIWENYSNKTIKLEYHKYSNKTITLMIMLTVAYWGNSSRWFVKYYVYVNVLVYLPEIMRSWTGYKIQLCTYFAIVMLFNDRLHAQMLCSGSMYRNPLQQPTITTISAGNFQRYHVITSKRRSPQLSAFS